MIILVLGGSGSGKSEYAENLAVQLEPEQKLYIATMYPWDEESKARIIRHREMRAKKKFDTLEAFYHLKETIDNYTGKASTAFLDCMSNLVANEMYCEEGVSQSVKSSQKSGQQQNEMQVVETILAGIEATIERFQHTVIVSNDVFSDGIDYDQEMQCYLRNLAWINQEIARKADLVVEVVCGIPLIQKGSMIR